MTFVWTPSMTPTPCAGYTTFSPILNAATIERTGLRFEAVLYGGRAVLVNVAGLRGSSCRSATRAPFAVVQMLGLAHVSSLTTSGAPGPRGRPTGSWHVATRMKARASAQTEARRSRNACEASAAPRPGPGGHPLGGEPARRCRPGDARSPGAERDAPEELGRSHGHEGRRHGRQGDRAGRPLREHGCEDDPGGRPEDVRRRGRRDDHGDGARPCHLP